MKKKLLFLFCCIPFFVVSQGVNTPQVMVSQWWISELITVVSEYFIEEEAPLITVDFTFTNNNMCEGTMISFTSTVTDEVGNIDYDWDFGDGLSSTQINPSHSYNPPNGCGTTTYNVTLTVTDENDDTDTISYDVIVLESPTVDVTDIDSPFDPFSNCASASQNFLINVGNASDSCISTFSVDWGDGNVENNITFPISHNYSQIGVYQMTFTGVGNNGCTNSITYPVKNVSNPAGGLVSPGNTNNLCAPTEELVFSITSWGENSDDTTYNVDYGDGTTISYSQLDLKASPYYDSSNPSNSANFPIPHIYSSSSCPEGGYDLTLTITNACDTTTSQLLNITVLSNADPDFVWTGNECVGSSILFESSGDLGYGPDCNQNAIYNWDFGDGNTISNGSSSASHIYTSPGIYDVTLSVEMYCGEATITRQICIENTLIPLFTIDNNEGCTPIQVSTTNNTDTTSVCSAETYLWQINYVDDGCGVSPPDWQFINGTDANSLNPEFSFVTPGTYSLTLTVTNGCGSTISTPQDIIVKKPPTVLINAIDDFCGIASVIPTAIIENCTPNASEMIYEWSFPDGFPSTSNLETPGTIFYITPGNHTITLTVTNNCGSVSTTEDFIIYEIPTIIDQPIVSQLLCQGTIPVDLEVVASGGTGTFNYQWYSNTINSTTGGILITGATNAIYTPPTTTVGILYYYVVISQVDAPDCNVVSDTSEVEVLAAPIFTQQPIGSSVCENGAATILEVVYSDGTGTPTYQWYSNTTNSTTGGTAITGATSSTYDPLTTPVGMTYYYCIISFTGGGCSEIISDTALVEVTAAVVIDSQPIATQEVCIGGEVSTVLTVTYSGGSGTVSYQWYENTTNSNTGGTIITGATTATYMPPVFTTSGTYYYYVTVALDGSGCSDATSAVSEVIVVEDPVVDSQPIVSQSLCQGAIPTDLEVVASGGIGTFNYQWYSNTTNSTTGGTLITGATNAIYTPPTTTVGILYYYVEISQAPSNLDCFVVSETSEVEVTLAPSFILQPVSSDVCINDAATILEVAYSDGIGTPTYQWYSNTTNSTIGGTAILGATSSTYDPPTNTVGTLFYYCEISFSSGGCSIIISDTAEVNVSQTPVVSDYNNAVCSSLLFEFDPATILGNTVPTGTIYTWSLPVINPSGAITGATASGTSQTIFLQTLTNITTSPATAIYTVTPISGICVGNTFNIEVLVNPAISVTATIIDSNCFNDNNGSITTNITGGTPINPTNPYIISWSGPNGFTSNNADITNLEPGVYTLDVLDDSSCTFSMDYEVKEPDELLIQNDLVQDISCFGNDNGQISISVSGGTLPYTYLWSTLNGSGLIVDAEDQSNLALGNYDVLITDANNCTVTSSFEIIEPIELLISETHNSLDCYGDTNGEIVVVIDQQTFSDYTYLITGTDYLGNPYNGTTTVSDITHTFNGLLAGIYSVTVTDANDCFKLIDTIEITQPSGIVINYTKVDETCFGSRDGSITLNVTGGTPTYTYQWSDFGSGPTRTNLSAGTYTVIVTDQNNCSQTESIEILGPEFHIEPEFDNISCFGENDGHIKLNIVGGISPITVTWNDDASAGEERNNLSPGTYTVVVTDADSPSCPINETFIITEPAALSVSGNVTNALDCDNVNSGAINLLVSGGTLPLSFSWSNGATSEDLNAIPPGDYTVIVTDANGCDESRSFNVYRPEELELDVEMVVNSNCSTREVEQRNELNITGGIPPYTIQWSRGAVDPATPTVMVTNVGGAVLADVTDSMGCTRQLVFDVELEKIGFPGFEMTSFGFEEYGVYSIDDPIFFTNTSTETPIEVSWNFGDQSETTNEFSPQHTYFNVGTYAVTLTVTYPYGCEYELTTQIVITQGYDVILPTAFTPNSDGINDTIRPSFFGLKEIEMSVFDTWGQKVYSENTLSLKGWDGMINGNYAENGNYVLSVRVVTFYGKEIKLNTPITLLR